MSDWLDRMKEKYTVTSTGARADLTLDDPEYEDLELNRIYTWRTLMNRLLAFVIKKLKESNTWLGGLLAMLGVPQMIQDPVLQIVAAGATVITFFLAPEGRQEAKEQAG